jgi:dipeptidyl aminopeptidase/acylaminoacyl peptidase
MASPITTRRRFIAAEDLAKFRFVGDPQVSPDGRRVLYTVKVVDGEKYQQHLWVEEEQYTLGKVTDILPRWSPDGRKIAFVRTTDDDSQVWIMSITGGEPRPITQLPPGQFKALEWSPDGNRIAFVFHKDPAPELKKEKKQPLLRHVTRLHYKEEGAGFLDAERDHVHVIWLAERRVVQLTEGDADDAMPAWSPDGLWIAFVSNRLPDADYRAQEIDLWVAASGGGEPRKLPKPAGPAFWPQWSPDGKQIAFLGHDKPESCWGATNLHVWLVPASGAQPARDLLAGFDRTCEDVVITDTKGAHGAGQKAVWSEDGREIYFLASDSGSCHLHGVTAAGGKPRRLTNGSFEVMNFTYAKGRFALSISDPQNIGDLYEFHPGGEPRRRTRVNQALFDGLRLSTPEPFDSAPAGLAQGKPFEGGPQAWLLKPPTFSAEKKYPLILYIHGGPRAMYGNAFFHEFQVLAAKGYLVLYPNPRGSQGYGEAFADAIKSDWGNLDYQDLMAAVDAAVKLPYVDASRLGVAGGSYGGYMTNWIVGHTDRFKAAVSERCVANLYSFYGTSDFGYEDFREFTHHAFDDPEHYAKLSPVTYVKNIRTPLLLIHSEGDLRCPIEQAEQMYGMLKAMKREVEFLRFPEENHDLSRSGRPDRRLARLEFMLKWWEKHL